MIAYKAHYSFSTGDYTIVVNTFSDTAPLPEYWFHTEQEVAEFIKTDYKNTIKKLHNQVVENINKLNQWEEWYPTPQPVGEANEMPF